MVLLRGAFEMVFSKKYYLYTCSDTLLGRKNLTDKTLKSKIRC